MIEVGKDRIYMFCEDMAILLAPCPFDGSTREHAGPGNSGILL